MKKIIKLAGSVRGLSFDSIVNSYIDAGLHLGIDANKIKVMLNKHFGQEIDFGGRGIYSI